MSPLAISSRMAANRNQSARRRWISGNEVRHRSRRGGKNTPHPPRTSHPLALTPFQPHQETVTQHDQDGIPMKAMPQASLILIPTQFAFGFFMILFNPVPPMRVFNQLTQTHLRRKVTPTVFPVARLPRRRTLSNQPAEMTMSLTVAAPAPQGHKTRPQPTARAFLPTEGVPLPSGQRLQDRTACLNRGGASRPKLTLKFARTSTT